MKNIGKAIGERIKFLRKQKGISQEQLALKAEINTSYMGLIERGSKSPTLKILDKIVQALDITFEDLFDLDEEIDNKKELPIIDKIKVQMNGRSIEDQEFIYNVMKQILSWKDKK